MGYTSRELIIPDSLYNAEKWSDAAKQYHKANKRFEAENNWKGMVYTDYMLADIYFSHTYNSKLREEYIDRSRKLLKGHFKENPVMAADFYLIDGTGMLYNKPDSSLVLINKAMKIYNEIFGITSKQSGECYFCMAQVLVHTKWNFDSARSCLQRSESILKNYYPDSSIRIIRNYYYNAVVYHSLYDFKNAIINSEQTLSLLMIDSVRNYFDIATLRGMLGNLYSDLMNDSIALYYYRLSIPVYESKAGNQPELCKMLLNVCENNLRYKKLDTAAVYLNKAIRVYHKMVADSDALSKIHYDKGWYYSLAGNYDSAKYFLTKALILDTKEFKSNDIRKADVLEMISTMHYKKANYDSALYYIQEALNTLDSTFKNRDYSANPVIDFNKDRVRLYNYLSLKATIFSQLHENRKENNQHLKEALKIYNLLDQLGDQMRNSDIPEDSQLILASLFQAGNEKGIECARELFDNTGEEKYLSYVLKFMEKSKYMELFKAAHIAQKSHNINVPQNLLHYYDSLNTQIARLDQVIDFVNGEKMVDFKKLGELNTRRLLLTGKRKEFVEEMDRKYPGYFYVNFDSLSTSINEITNYIKKEDRLFIEYYLGEKNIYILGISGNRLTLNVTSNNKDFRNDFHEYLSLVSERSKPDSVISDFKKYSACAFRLYQILLEPVLKEQGFMKSGHLLIVPDGALARIPFEAFIREAPGNMNGNYGALHFLIKDYLIRYIYSANFLLKNNNNNRPAKRNMLAFSYSGPEALADARNRSAKAADLPGTAMEIKAIKKVMKGKNKFFQDENATEHNFKVNAPYYKIIHLAIHGQADLSNPLNSKLLFRSGGDSSDDGQLFVYELYNLDLSKSELAVLSACETGLGKNFNGEGVFSVARGFVYAGCPTVIMSLWRVNDRLSASIMGSFYRQLMKGKKTAEALRASKLKFLESAEGLQAHPSNWAAFVMLGRNYTVARNSLTNYYIAIIIILIAGTLFLIFRKRIFSSLN